MKCKDDKSLRMYIHYFMDATYLEIDKLAQLRLEDLVNKSIKISRNFTESMIIDMLNYILESDYKIKKGLMRDTLAIEMLVSKYCQRRVS